MTTIACSLGEMAGDTRVSWTEGKETYNTSTSVKVERVNDELVGTAGDLPSGVKLMAWIRGGMSGRKPKISKDTAVIRLTSGGIYAFDGKDPEWLKIDAPFFAIGSGARYAIGAMEMGADVKRAVEVAMKYDPATGGSITFLKLKESA